ncbi:MAG: LysR family transcriptional regulator [Cognatishimia sp.]
MSAHWDDLKTVMHLVREGSLATAGDALGVSYTTVARRIKRAEEDLGMQLFERLADGYQPTESGQVVARKAALMEIEEHDLMRNLLANDANLSGALTITAPQLLCASYLAPVFAEFTDRYPDVELIVRADNELLDLNRREADLAIRISRAPGDTLRGRRLSEMHSATYASPEWVERLRQDPTIPVDWIVMDKIPEFHQQSLAAFPNARIRMKSDDMLSMVGAARAGMGVAQLPMFLGRYFSDLERVSDVASQPFSEIWLVAHRDVWASARVAAFREILVPHFKEHQHLFVA